MTYTQIFKRAGWEALAAFVGCIAARLIIKAIDD